MTFLALVSKGFSTYYVRTYSNRFLLNIRRLGFYSDFNVTGNQAKFNTSRAAINNELNLWRTNIVPLFTTGPGTRMTTDVYDWTGSDYAVKRINAFESTSMIENYGRGIYENTFGIFSNKTAAYYTPNVRFFFDNIWTLFNFWTDVRDAQFIEHETSIGLLRAGFIACISAIGVFTVIFALVSPFFSLSSFRARQYRIMDLLTRLPKKPVLDALTRIEEEIELLALDETQLVSSKSVLNSNSSKWTFVLPGRYLLAITFFLILTGVKVFFVLNHVDTTMVIPRIYEPLIFLKNLCPTLNRYMWDMFEDDPTTYALGRPRVKAEFTKTLSLFEENTRLLGIRLADHLPPKASTNDTIFKVWRAGVCYADPKNASIPCGSRTFKPEVGFTYQLATSGVEFQLNTMIQTVKKYIDGEEYKLKTASPSLQLYELLWPDVFNNFELLVKEYNEYSATSTMIATAVLFTLSAGVVLSFGVYYYLGFWGTFKKYTGGNHQLVSLVYMIHASERVKNPDLNTFIESAGASIN